MLPRPIRTVLVLMLATAACTGTGDVPIDPALARSRMTGPGADLPCIDIKSSPRRGAEMLEGRYEFGIWDPVELPDDIDWSHNPVGDINWEGKLHNLLWTEDLVAGYLATGDQAYLDRYREILQDWLADHPPGERPYPSRFSWNRHITAQRGFIYACALRFFDEPWLRDAILLHGRTLARPNFYIGHGNHALNQAIDLFFIGCAMDRQKWRRLGAQRIADLARESIDQEGVNNEQSVYYHYYNYTRYGVAAEVLERCGEPIPRVLAQRRPLMPRFLAHATVPTGEMVWLGDTIRKPMPPIEGTPTEFAATQGRSGPKPDSLSAVFSAGYAFGRSGWGERRRFEDETMYALRFGPAPEAGHAHWEGTSLFLFGYGQPLLDDSGIGRYGKDEWREYFKSPRAQNRVIIDGARFEPEEPTRLVATRTRNAYDAYVLKTGAWKGVDTTRRVIYSRRGDYMVVHDELTSKRRIDARQLWHLSPDANPAPSVDAVRTQRGRGNVTIRWLGEAPAALTLTSGERDPIQGWSSYKYADWVPAPVVSARQKGKRVSYLTLVVPYAKGEPDIRIHDLRQRADGFTVELSVGAISERIDVRGNTIRVRVA